MSGIFHAKNNNFEIRVTRCRLDLITEQLGGTNILLPAADAVEGYQANVIALKANEAVNTRKRVEIAAADLMV